MTPQAFLDALNPDKMKGLLIGEFSEESEIMHGDELYTKEVPVTWGTIKDLLAAILEQAQLNAGWECITCGSKKHILAIRDEGASRCCPDRRLISPEQKKQWEEAKRKDGIPL